MRDEKEVEAMADRVSGLISGGTIDKGTLIDADGKPHDIERLRGILDALDWALGDREDDPV